MLRRLGLALVCVLPLALVGCAEKNFSPEEIVSALQSSGCKATSEARIHHTVRGANYAFWINIDGVRVSAWRYDRIAQAEAGARSMLQGFNVRNWAFEMADSTTAEKIRRALK